jgi:hypothetical protein
MKHVQESLDHYKDFVFFSLLEQNDKERKEKSKQFLTPDKKRGDPKKSKQKDPKKEQEEKFAAQSLKDVQAVIKKAEENYKRMKSAGGGKIEVYKKFWDNQLKAKETLLQKDPGVKAVYNMYDSDYIVVGSIEAENAYIIVLKKDAKEEENPICKISGKEGYESFKNFTIEMKNDLKRTKDTYVKNVENKKKEEEERQRREKLEGFLKEEKESENKKEV